MSVRIIGLDEVSTIQDGNYIAIDSETGGTKKFDATKVGYLMGQNIAPDYNSSAQYVVGEFCMYDGKLYKCTTNITTPEAWNAGHWTQVTVGTSLYDKVDKVSGKGLSSNDFTDALKTKLDSIEQGAEVNVQADWNQTNSTADDYIQNKPTSDTTLSIAGAFADAKTVGDALGELDETEKLYMANIPDTTQTITLTNGMLSQILHKSGNTTVRTDTFAYGSGSFTETRTLGTGASLTIVTDLSTFVTTVTYTGA